MANPTLGYRTRLLLLSDDRKTIGDVPLELASPGSGSRRLSSSYWAKLCLMAMAAGLFSVCLRAQQADSPAQSQAEPQPKVRLNYMNVCTPNAKEQEQITAALNAMLPASKPAADYETSRGRATGENDAVAWYIRLRREFPPKSAFVTAQYSISANGEKMTETLVLHPRDPKTVLQVSLEDGASLGSAPLAALLSVNSPVTRIKVEHFGSPSVGLDRCQETDQQAYEGIFRQASAVFAAYRGTLGLKSMLQRDLVWLQQKATGDKPKTGEQKSSAH